MLALMLGAFFSLRSVLLCSRYSPHLLLIFFLLFCSDNILLHCEVEVELLSCCTYNYSRIYVLLFIQSIGYEM